MTYVILLTSSESVWPPVETQGKLLYSLRDGFKWHHHVFDWMSVYDMFLFLSACTYSNMSIHESLKMQHLIWFNVFESILNGIWLSGVDCPSHIMIQREIDELFIIKISVLLHRVWIQQTATQSYNISTNSWTFQITKEFIMHCLCVCILLYSRSISLQK